MCLGVREVKTIASEKVAVGVVGRVVAGHAGAARFAQFGTARHESVNDGAEVGAADWIDDRVAVRSEVGAAKADASGTDEHGRAGDAHDRSGTSAGVTVAGPEQEVDVCLVWGLIGAEPRVAVDAKQ